LLHSTPCRQTQRSGQANFINLPCLHPTQSETSSSSTNLDIKFFTASPTQLFTIRQAIDSSIFKHHRPHNERPSPWSTSNFINTKYHKISIPYVHRLNCITCTAVS